MAEGKKKAKVVPIVEPQEGQSLTPTEAPSRRPRQIRRILLALSFILMVLIPSALGTAYFGFIASDRYVAGAGFSVRGMEAGGGGDFLGSFTGLASTGSTTSDSYILLKYLKSRDLVEQVDKALSLEKVYSRDELDYFSRLEPGLDIEHIVEYWGSRISTTYDSTSGIITFEAQAFTPEDAEQVADKVLVFAKAMVNSLSSQARSDAVRYAQAEVERAEKRLTAALDAIRAFRETQNVLDPASNAQNQQQIVSELQRQLAENQTRISVLKETVDSNSPALRNLIRQADAIEQQIKAQTEKMGGETAQGTALTGQISDYETLEIERNFAQQAYTSSLSSLEKARVEADQQQRYLAVYSEPALPQYPLYPRRVLNSILLFGGLLLGWGIAVLIGYAVNDHMN